MTIRFLCFLAGLLVVLFIVVDRCHLDEIVPLPGNNATPGEISMRLFEPFEGNSHFVLSQNIGNPIVINFWASWCGPCRTEMPLLEEAWLQYQHKGLLVVGIATQDSERGAKELIQALKLTYPLGLDGDGSIAMKYRITGLPSTFFITKQGVVSRRWVGTIDSQTLERLLIQLLDS